MLFSGSTSHCQCCIWEVFQIFHCIKRPCCSWNNTHDVLVLFLLSHFVDIALLDWSYSWVWWCRLHQVILERVRIFILIFALFIAVSSLQFGKISTQIDHSCIVIDSLPVKAGTFVQKLLIVKDIIYIYHRIQTVPNSDWVSVREENPGFINVHLLSLSLQYWQLNALVCDFFFSVPKIYF